MNNEVRSRRPHFCEEPGCSMRTDFRLCAVYDFERHEAKYVGSGGRRPWWEEELTSQSRKQSVRRNDEKDE